MSARRNAQHGGPSPHPRLTARSVLASTLLGLDPPLLRTSALVAGAELLGVAPGTARVAISRMVTNGELEPIGDGYRLAGHLLARQARQVQSVAGPPTAWNGTWRTALVPSEPRSPTDRTALRRAMAALRFGELREGTWLRPDNLAASALPEAEQVASEQTIAIVGQLAEDPLPLVARLWDLDAWASDAHRLLAGIKPLSERLVGDDASALAESFVVAAAALRHLQADPLLPVALLPADWPGRDLRERQRSFDGAFRRVLRDWHLSRP